MKRASTIWLASSMASHETMNVEKFHPAITLSGQLRKQEHGSSMVFVNRKLATTAADELDSLIRETEGIEADPLSNDVFQARDHLREALGFELEDE
jgi:antirestriction protein ArdC